MINENKLKSNENNEKRVMCHTIPEQILEIILTVDPHPHHRNRNRRRVVLVALITIHVDEEEVVADDQMNPIVRIFAFVAYRHGVLFDV